MKVIKRIGKLGAWAGTVTSPLLLGHFGLPLLGALLAVVIIAAGLYCWTVSSEDRSRHLAMLPRIAPGQPSPEAQAPLPLPVASAGKESGQAVPAISPAAAAS